MGCDEKKELCSATLPRGPRNLITDVAGVAVGHRTLRGEDVNTGVTAILPHGGNTFLEKLPAGHAVINGFGKTAGLMQLAEMGTLETPIILTNTLAVGTAFTAVVRHLMADNPAIGGRLGTVNPVIGECNDGLLNDIRRLSVTEADVLAALEAAGPDFQEGAVGAGTGMVSYGLKGGIGSASRLAEVEGHNYCVGALVLTNHGRLEDLRVNGRPVAPQSGRPAEPDKGSVMVILATDAPLDSRQLNRCCRRAVAGLSRGGSNIGSGSGEVVIGFSTACRIPAEPTSAVLHLPTLAEHHLDAVFRAVVEAVEDAVVSALLHANATTGYRGHTVGALMDLL